MVFPEREMIEAVESGNLAAVRRLLRIHDLYSTPRLSKGFRLLIKALQYGQREVAKYLLDSGAQVAPSHASRVLYEDSPLHLACSQSFPDIVKLCLQRGVDVNLADQRGQTPLDHTTDAATARLLLEKGAHFKDDFGHNQLYSKLIRPVVSAPNSDAALDWIKLIDDYGQLMDIVNQPGQCHDLVQYASPRLLHELLRRGLSARAKSIDGSYLIHDCARRGEVKKLRLLIEFGADVNARDSHGSTALHNALRANHLPNINTVKLLLKHGADPNILSPSGGLPLTIACQRGTEMLKILMRHGADVNGRNSGGSTALHIAVRVYPNRARPDPNLINPIGDSYVANCFSPYELLEYLVQYQGVDLNLKDNKSHTALHYAILYGKVSFVELLLAHGADPNIQDPSDITPLVMACREGTEMTKILLEHGADVLAVMPDGETVLSKMNSQSSSTIIDHMARHGLLTRLSDGNGNSPLHLIIKNGPYDCIETLLSNGLDPNQQNNDGETSLHLAIASRCENIVEILLNRGADISVRTTKGLTALHIAARLDTYTDSKLVEVLLQKSPPVNAVDIDGKTPLHHAIVNRRTFELLLKNGANLNAEDNRGRTPLYHALQSDAADVVKLFLKRGIDLPGRFRDGTTPIHVAARGGGHTLRIMCQQARRIGLDIDCLDANGETPLSQAILDQDRFFSCPVDKIIAIGFSLEHVYWVDRRRIRDWFSVKRRRRGSWSSPSDRDSEEVRQLAIKLSAAHLLPISLVHTDVRDRSKLPEYLKELEQLKKYMISDLMSLYDFLHDKYRLTAEKIGQVRYEIDTKLAEFPNYRGLIESKLKIDLARAEPLQLAVRRLNSYTRESPLLRHLVIPEEIIAKILLHLTHRELNVLNGEPFSGRRWSYIANPRLLRTYSL